VVSNYTLSVRCCAFRKYKNHKRPHHPLVVQKTKNIPGWFIHVLAVYTFFQAHYIPGTTFVPHFEPLHFIPLSFHAHTSAPHSFGSLLPFHSASSINSVSHYPSHFPTHFQWHVFIFCGELAPIERILLVLIRNGFFFQKDSKDKYNKDFLSIIFTDKKIKNLAKIRRPTQFNALGSKGQALRVFAIISTLSFHFR
jgi:hypothetical protein